MALAVLVAATAVQGASGRLAEQICEMARDPDPRVRFQAALTLGGIDPPLKTRALGEIVLRDSGDPWVRSAVLLSAGDRPAELLSDVFSHLAEAGGRDGLREFIHDLTEMIGVKGKESEIASTIALVASMNDESADVARAAALEGLIRGLRNGGGGARAIPGVEEPLAKLLASPENGVGRSTENLANLLLPADSKTLSKLVADAISTAGDTSRDESARARAAALLTRARFEEAGPVLRPLLEPANSEALQLAAIQSLSAIGSEEAIGMLIAALPGFTPKARDRALDALLSRPERELRLLDGLESGAVSVQILDPARRSRLLDASGGEVARRAAVLFDRKRGEEDPKLFEKYRAALDLEGSKSRGEKTFKDRCAQCHRLNGEGYALGPDLTSVRANPRETVLTNILYPNRVIAPGYSNYVVVTKDGREASGISGASTPASVVLRRAAGEEETIMRRDIQSLRDTELSIMPEGLEDGLGPQDLADLIAFVLEEP